MSIDVTVVIPVYNGEKYVRRCVECVQNQTHKNIEIMIVDDGSTDNSLQMCMEYAAINNRIKVISKENGGSTSARRAGVQAAKGKYIAFVDCDDYIVDNYIENLINNAYVSGADIVIEDAVRHSGESAIIDKYYIEKGIYKGKILDDYFIPNMFIQEDLGWGIRPTLWGKLFKQKLIQRKLENVDEKIFYGEDTACLFSACLEAKCISVIEEAGYHYYENPESISNRKNSLIFENNCLLYEYLKKEFDNCRWKDVLQKQLKFYMYDLLDYALGKMLGTKELSVKSHNKINKTLWVMPEFVIEKGSKIILYGAGNVGESYRFQVTQNPKYEMIAWTDGNYQRIIEEKGYHLVSTEIALSLNYDYILLAVLKESVALTITEKLIKLGVEKEKILWNIPRPINNVFFEVNV